MSALPLLSELAGRGVRIRVDGIHLAVSQDNLTDSLITKIQDNKPALIADLEKLQRIAGSDWQKIVSHPEQLRDFIHSFVTTEARGRGEIPSHYTAIVHCQTCSKDVPHFPVGVEMVEACVWCLNGQPVPVNDVAWLKRKLAPQSALTEQRLTDFYLHATAVEKSELGRIFKREFKLN